MREFHDVAIIVPSYNSSAFLRVAVESALSQDFDHELCVFVVDDGSTDGTEALVNDWFKNRAVRYIRQERDGPATARNTGISVSQSKYIMLLDADDILIKGCVQQVFDLMESHESLGLAFPNFEIFDETGIVHPSGVDIRRHFRNIPHREVGPALWVFEESLAKYIVCYGSFMHTSGLMVKRELLEKYGAFRPGYYFAEDDDFLIKISFGCDSGYVDRVLCRARNHANSLKHDLSRRVSNVESWLKLSELQLLSYAAHPEMASSLRRLIGELVVDYVWGLMRDGRDREAAAVLKEYLPRYPLKLKMLKLMVRSCINHARKW